MNDIGNQSDGVTESPLRRSTAPLSTEPHREEAAKATRHLALPEYVVAGSPGATYSLSNSIFSVPPTPVTIAAFGLLGSICYRDKDCSVAYSRCRSSICTCRSGYTQSADRQTCVGKSPSQVRCCIAWLACTCTCLCKCSVYGLLVSCYILPHRLQYGVWWSVVASLAPHSPQ